MSTRQGGGTGDNNRCLRYWWEINIHDFSLVLDDGKSNLLKTQVKFCNRRHSESDSLELALYNTNSNRPHYTSQQIDLLLVYLPEIDKVLAYKEDIFHEKKTITINLTDANSKYHYSKFI